MAISKAHLAVWTVVLAGGLAACGQIPFPYVSGKAVYEENCVMCHGVAGKGDGPLADDLFVRPADLTQLTANNGGEFPRLRIMSHIDGYARGDNSSGAMPEFGPLLVGENVLLETGEGVVTPTPQALLAVTNYLVSIQAN